MSSDILVVGSMNMDLVVQSKRYPEQGETIIGRNFDQIPGGKGANQAVAAGKLGANVSFIGACGQDQFGTSLLSSIKDSGVDTSSVFKVKDSTGVALITIENNGDNRIIVVQGANAGLSPDLIDKVEDNIKEAEVVLLQLEIPLETVVHTIKIAHRYNTRVILDPAPARELPENIYQKIDYILPNEGELSQLLINYGYKTDQEKVEQLLNLGVGTVLVTRGEKGVSLYRKDKIKSFNAHNVEVVDTTGAGDAFAGAFAYGLVRGWEEDRAIHFASLVAGLAVTRLGAQSSMPDFFEVEEFREKIGLKF